MSNDGLERQNLFRRLACLCAIAAIPGYVLCGLDHFCMCGHLVHSRHPAWHNFSDVGYILLLGMSVVFAARSNVKAKRWLLVIPLLMIFPRFLLGLAAFDFIAVPPLMWLSVRGLFRRAPNEPKSEPYRHGDAEWDETQVLPARKRMRGYR